MIDFIDQFTEQYELKEADLGKMNVCIILDYHRKKTKSKFVVKANQEHNMNEHDLFIAGEVWQLKSFNSIMYESTLQYYQFSNT